MKIYDFQRGARGLRAAWLCEELGTPYEFEAVGFPPSPHYLAINPLGTVPHLVDGDVSMGESVAMLLFIAQRNGPTPLVPDAPSDLARTLELTVFGEAALACPMDVLLAVKYMAPRGETGGWAAGATRSRLSRAIDHVDRLISEREYLVGNALTTADISVAASLVIWRHALQETLSPVLSDYLERMQRRPAYAAAAASSAKDVPSA